jgi:hypothetical protein
MERWRSLHLDRGLHGHAWCIDRLREDIVTDVIARHSERFPHLFKERPVEWLRMLHAMLSLRRSISCGIFVKTDTFTEVTEEENDSVFPLRLLL